MRSMKKSAAAVLAAAAVLLLLKVWLAGKPVEVRRLTNLQKLRRNSASPFQYYWDVRLQQAE